MLVLLTCDCPTACIGPLWPVPCWAQVSLESRKSKSEAKYLHLSLASIWWGLVSSCPTCASAYGNTAVIRKSTVCPLSPQTLNLPQAVSQIPRGMNSVLHLPCYVLIFTLVLLVSLKDLGHDISPFGDPRGCRMYFLSENTTWFSAVAGGRAQNHR